MTDYTSEGSVPVDDAAVEDPPTVDEVLEQQRQRDDLPDPSEDPDHQQVVEPGSPHPSAESDDSEGLD